MTRGFATIATGSDHFYEIAANLLASYHCFAKDPLPFALLCDRENEYSKLFDQVVIIENPHCSYLDKLALPALAPFDETIFVDSDCLAYRDLNDFWDHFEEAPDFAVFGRHCPPDREDDGWFNKGGVGEYAEAIDFIPDFPGWVYFMRKGEGLEAFSDLSYRILENYSAYTFRGFEKPADEPIFALAMAVSGFKPVSSDGVPLCFYALADPFESNIERGIVRYAADYDRPKTMHSWAYLVHWGSRNTYTYPYTLEVERLRHLCGECGKLRTAFTIARMESVRHVKGGVRTLLAKLRLLDFARTCRRSLSNAVHRDR